MDSVEVGESGIEQTTGFWFSPNVKGIKFTDLIEVTLTTELNRNNRPAEIWYAKYSTGEVIRVDPGDLWDLNTREIVEYMIQSGIRVVADGNAIQAIQVEQITVGLYYCIAYFSQHITIS
jgi:hypothetical protein